MSSKQLALALQGGGSHGAYTWGVLDRLLEDDRVEIEGISGASAGAMNAVVLAHGYGIGGRDGAREALNRFWGSVSDKLGHAGIAGASPVPVPDATARAYLFLTRFFSPYQLNPLNLNPLRDIITAQIDFERLRASSRIKLFISATRVSNGALRIFSREELTADALLASACIPSVHHSVEVDGAAYWDGGLTANPPLSVLLYKCSARDMLVVVLNPQGNDDVPATADAIGERLSQISFSSTLSAELQAIALAKAEAERSRFSFGRLDRKLRRLNIHVIDSAQYMAGLAPASRYNTDSGFITALRDEGRARADAWLKRNFSAVGQRSTAALDAPVLQP
jgi:NTE family protein